MAQRLFPQNVRENYTIDDIKYVHVIFHVHVIDFRVPPCSFNPCSVTSLKECLRRAQSAVQPHVDSLKLPGQPVIDSIVASAMGDIRCAMNQFRFACLKGKFGVYKIPSLFLQNFPSKHVAAVS